MDTIKLNFRDKKTGATWSGTPQEAKEMGISDELILSKLKTAKELEKGLAGEDITKTESQKTKEAEAKAELDDLEALAKAIKEKAQSGKNVSGAFTGKSKERLAGLREILPFVPGGDFIKDVGEMRSLASQLAAEIGFGEAGKSFTETEKSMLQGQIPELDVAEEKNQNFLFRLLGIQPGKKGVTGAVLDTEEELIIKMDAILDTIERKRKGETIRGFPKVEGYTIEEM